MALGRSVTDSPAQAQSYTERPAQPQRHCSPRVLWRGGGALRDQIPAAHSNARRAGTNEEGAGREGGAAGRRQPCGSSSLYPPTPPLSSLLFLSKQGKVFHEASFRLAFSSLTPAAAPVRALAGGARAGNPSAPGSAGRGAAPAAAHGRSHPARTPRRRARLARGPSAAPSRPGGRQRLSGEVPAVGSEMTLLLLLCLGECLGASGRPEGPGRHTPASGPGRWLSTVVLQSLE